MDKLEQLKVEIHNLSNDDLKKDLTNLLLGRVPVKYKKAIKDILEQEELYRNDKQYIQIRNAITKPGISEKKYNELKSTGMLWELCPKATGEYNKDKFIIKK